MKIFLLLAFASALYFGRLMPHVHAQEEEMMNPGC